MNKVNETGKIGFDQAWKDMWKGYFDFKGISTRAGFWWTALFYLIGIFLAGFIGGSLMGIFSESDIGKIIYYILAIMIIIPLLATAARRFRDIGLKEGLIIVLIIAYIILKVLIYINYSLVYFGVIYNIAIIILLCMPTGKFNKE
ncbi:DUF805 domain-containing protein [Ligilactobacillus sp. LYQ135]